MYNIIARVSNMYPSPIFTFICCPKMNCKYQFANLEPTAYLYLFTAESHSLQSFHQCKPTAICYTQLPIPGYRTSLGHCNSSIKARASSLLTNCSGDNSNSLELVASSQFQNSSSAQFQPCVHLSLYIKTQILPASSNSNCIS